MCTSTSTGPGPCGGAITTSSVAVSSTTVAPAPPKLTYNEQNGAGQSSGGLKRPAPWMWTYSPPCVSPPAGAIVETATAADAGWAASATATTAERNLMTTTYG